MRDLLKNHSQWPKAFKLMKVLKNKGFEVVVAGGAVRDALLGRRDSGDLDIASSASPEQVQELFEKVIPVGESFGVCRVVFEGAVFEVASFRKDGLYVDGRRPKTISQATIEEDAWRRDFTVNALFYDPFLQEVLDPTDQGVPDLAGGVLRAVGVAEDRFKEDHLRLLRALRFQAQLDFTLEAKTKEALVGTLPLLSKVAVERVVQEMEKVFDESSVQNFLKLCQEHSLFEYLPAAVSLQEPQWTSIHGALSKGLPKEKEMIWCYLAYALWRHASHEPLNWFKDLKLPKRVFTLWNKIIGYQKILMELELTSFTSQLHMMRDEEYSKIFLLVATFETSERAQELKKHWQGFLIKYGEDGKISAPFITGKDLVEANLAQPSPEIKRLIEKCYEIQIKEKIKEKKEILRRIEDLSSS